MPKSIYLDNTVLTKDKKATFLTGDVVAGAQAIGIQSTIGFTSLTTSSGQILLVGELGQERSEIVLTSNISTSTGSNIGGTGATLKTVLRFDHPQDTKVYIIDWDRFEIQTAATATGTKSTLMAYPEGLQPDQLESIYRDTTQTSGFYFVRFNETVGSTNSDWSDPIPYGGFKDNSVFAIKQRALEQLNEKVDEFISNEFLNRCLWEARREIHQAPGKRPFRRSYNVDIGNVLTGSAKIELPTYVERPYSAENVYGVRIGTNANMDFYDKKDWDTDWLDKPHSFLTTAYAVGNQDLYVSDPRDFAESGSVTVEGTTIAYSAKSNAGGTMRISTSGSWAASVGSDVWQNASYGLPDRFTVFATVGGSAFIYFNRALDTTYIGQNIYLDYYRTLLEYDSDADELDEPDYDMFVPYLKFRIKQRKNAGLNPLSDPDYQEWQLKKQNALAKEYGGVEIRLQPNIDHLL